MVTVLHRVMLIIALGEVWDVASVFNASIITNTIPIPPAASVYSMVIRATT